MKDIEKTSPFGMVCGKDFGMVPPRTQRRCCGYDTGSSSELVINPDEAATVCWIFERCLSGDSLGKIAAGLEEQGISSPTGKPERNWEALNKLLSNEKYMGRVLLQKTISVGSYKFKNDGFMDRYLYSDSHEAIISDEMFKAAQQKTAASKMPRQNICHAGVFLIKYKFRMAKWVNAIPSGNKNKRRGKRLCVAAYCRVSTTFEEQRGSLKVQQQFYTSMVDMRPDWINAGIFSDHATGLNTAERPGLNAMLRCAVEGKSTSESMSQNIK